MKKEINWISIEKEYRVGQLSLREIARQHEIPESTLRYRSKGWGERDLTDQVRRQVHEKLLRNNLRIQNAQMDLPTDEEIIDEASDRGAKVIELHRKDITELREREKSLLEELGDKDNPPVKTHVSNYMGEVTLTEFRLTVVERASTLNALMNIMHKRIALERQSYSLDENSDSNTSEENPLAALLAEIDGQSVKLVNEKAACY